MKLDCKLKELGPVDYGPLKAAVLAAGPEAWLEDQMRQKSYEVHTQTQSIVLLFCDGWPQMEVTRRAGWDRFAHLASPLMKHIIDTHYRHQGGVLRAMIAKMAPGAQIATHYDAHPSFGVAHRIHVPLQTNDAVDFIINDEVFHLKEGIAYEVSNLDMHSVANRGSQDRLHFIFDYTIR